MNVILLEIVRQLSQLSVNPKYGIFKNIKREVKTKPNGSCSDRLIFLRQTFPCVSQWPLSTSYITPHPCRHHSAAGTHVDPTVSTSVRQISVVKTWGFMCFFYRKGTKRRPTGSGNSTWTWIKCLFTVVTFGSHKKRHRMVQHRDKDHVWSGYLSLCMLKQKAGAFLLQHRRCQGWWVFFGGGSFSCDLSNNHSKQSEHRATLKSEAEHRNTQKRHLRAVQPEDKTRWGNFSSFYSFLFSVWLERFRRKVREVYFYSFNLTSVSNTLDHFWYINCVCIFLLLPVCVGLMWSMVDLLM